MSPARRTSRARSRFRWASSLASVGVVTSLVMGQAPVEPPAAQGAVRLAATTTAAAAPLAAASAARAVAISRTSGTVVGDGRTRYVANGTEFRPRSTEVRLPPQVRARSWVIVDLDTGRLLGKHLARRRLPQASTLKLLTAVTATRTIGARKVHRVTRFEADQICSCAGILPGRDYRRNVLLAGMLLKSGNDAAEAVAGSHPRGRHAFYAAMNRVAGDLGAVDTVAKNASGLTATGSYSTARDLVIFLRAALAHPRIKHILSQPSAEIVTADGRRRHTVWRSTGYVNTYANSLGKSGWTTPAQNTLVVRTQVHGRNIAVATLGAPSGYSISGTRALTMWAARNFEGLKAVGQLPAG